MQKKPSRVNFRRRLQEMVAHIKTEIESGGMKAGDFLPSEVALSEQFAMSKNSVRRGLDLLVEEGLIEKIPRVGNRIRERANVDRTTLNFYYYYPMKDDVLLERIIELFHQDHPDIRVQSYPITYEYYNRSLNEHMENETMDVVAIISTDFGLFDVGRVPSLLEPIPEDQEVYPFLGDAFRVGSALYAKPFYFAPVVLCYNKDHFREAGILEPDSSWKWADAMNAAKTLFRRNGQIGLYYHLLSSNRWPIFLLQSGAVFRRNEDGRVPVAGTPLQDAFKLGKHLIFGQTVSPTFMTENDQDAQEMFLQGKISMTLASYTLLNRMRDSDVNYDIAPLPYSHVPATLLQYIGLAVNKKSKRKKAAETFVRYLTSYKAQAFIRQHSLSIPAMKRAAESVDGEERLNRPSRFWLYREIVPSFRLHGDLHLTFEQIETIGREMKMYWSGMEELDETCKKLERLL